MPERTIAFRIDEELHKRVKMRIIEVNKSLKDYVIDLILKDLDASANAQDPKKMVYSTDVQTFFNDFWDYVQKKLDEESDKSDKNK